MQTRATNRENGIALIVVLLIVAIIMVIAVEMSSRLQLNVARTSNLKANNQAYWYALGAEHFAKNSLTTLVSLTGENINLSQPWAEEFEYPVQGGSIKATLTDMQACFNLNAVNSGFDANANPNKQNSDPNTEIGNSNTDPSANQVENKRKITRQITNNPTNGPSQSQKAFHRLLEYFIQDSLVTDTIRDSLVDWIDDNSQPENYGAEDADYESLVNPYLAANNPLGHPSELRLINGIEQAMQIGSLDDLLKVVCVLPETRLKVNVNTITQENAVVLSSLLGDTSDSGLNIIQSRPEDGFKKKEDFLALSEIVALDLSPEQKQWFEVTTTYFKLNTTSKFQGSQFRLSTIFKLDEGKVSVVSREFGGAF